jgi:acetyltransferase-like isoleucine patch superfamily enzyme
MWSPNRHITIGDDVGIGPRCVFLCDSEIGCKVLIAGGVSLVGADDHRIDVVGSAMWDSGRGDTKKVVIEDDVWIGQGAIIVAGSRIGRGSIVGAGAVVVGDIEPYSIVVTQKARVIRKRFQPHEIVQHEEEMARAARAASRGSRPSLLSRLLGHTSSANRSRL